MKRITPLLVLLTLILSSCGSGLTVADTKVLKDDPDLEGPVYTWQAMVDAAENDDCAAFLDTMRLTLKLTEEVCPAAFEYLKNPPEVDWSRTEWSATKGKAKIYELDGGSIASFIHNTADDTWRSDTLFWEE